MTKLCISLFDYTGNQLKPWLDAGFMCLLVDIKHPPGLTAREDGMWLLQADLTKPFVLPPQFHGREVAFVSAFPPCDHLAISGARWFKGKGLRALARSVDMFATAAEFCESGGAPYFIENPVSTISTYWRDFDYKFPPHWFTGGGAQG